MTGLGLKVANVGAQYGGAYIGDPVFHPFWEAIEARGVTVWIHPEGMRDPWFQRYALWNSAGQSIEEAKCLIFARSTKASCTNIRHSRW